MKIDDVPVNPVHVVKDKLSKMKDDEVELVSEYLKTITGIAPKRVRELFQTQFKDNSYTVCNNKTYFGTKKAIDKLKKRNGE